MQLLSNLFRFFLSSQAVKEYLPIAHKRFYNSAAAEPFLNGTSSSYVEEMYNAWLRDPASVHTVCVFLFIFAICMVMFDRNKYTMRSLYLFIF